MCLPATRVTLSKIWMSFWLVISGWLAFAPRLRMPPLLNMIWLIAEVVGPRLIPGMPDRLRGVGPVVDRGHEELDRAPADAELVQQVRAERVRVVEREPLRLDVAFAGAEGEPGVAVRQRRRQDAVRLLVAVAPEEAVGRRQHVIDLEVDLVVLALQRRVDQVVVDRLAGGAARPGGVGFGNQLVQDVLGRRIPSAGRDDVAGKRQVA